MMLSKIHRAAVSSRSRSSFSSVVLNYGYGIGTGGRNGSMSIISGELMSHNSGISRLDIGLGGFLRTYFTSIESGSGSGKLFINNNKAYYSTGLSNIISVNRRLFCTETTNKNTQEIPNKNNQQRSESKGGEENFRPIDAVLFFLQASGYALALYVIWPEDQKKQISFQEFKTKLLEPGLVDHIVVSNKTKAKVYVKNSPMTTNQKIDGAAKGAAIGTDSSTNQSQYKYYFNIGSVDSFEQKLEEAHKALNISHRDYVPVMYDSNDLRDDSVFCVLLVCALLLLLLRKIGY